MSENIKDHEQDEEITAEVEAEVLPDEETSSELEILQDKYLRLAAEYDNFRKRTAKEKEGLYAAGLTGACEALLPVLDNIERALIYTDAEKLNEGLRLIAGQFIGALAGLGITEIPSQGCAFDPELHNAVAHEEAEGQPESSISEVLQKGYIRDGRVIRPAMVKVVN